ncbi:MAG: signal recognition particle-docking protein FtsY [Gemmatimonadetes bacterium]|nr:signal recognition particle-docking protein FtsY [Gemmatimonadota bacterium]
MALFQREPTEYRKTRSLWDRIRDLATTDAVTLAKGLDPARLDRLEEVLISADFGAGPSSQVVEEVRGRAMKGRMRNERDFQAALQEEMLRLLDQTPEDAALRENPRAGEPTCWLVVGVNGVGKTTTIAKMAHRAVAAGRRVLLVAGDTFRAGAIEQLRIWSDRLGSDFVAGAPGADPAAVAYSGIEAALSRGADLVICDTAGRLHTQHDLMGELGKVERVIGRRVEGAPHETLLVLDATIGQNAIAQSYVFRRALNLTGIVLTKLDGTARGGVAVAVRRELGLPIKLVGTGESLEDLSEFDPEAFVAALTATSA